MKIAVCAQESGLDSKVDGRFGRCESYVIFDTETKEVVTISNEAKNEPSGAGSSAVRLLNTNGTDIVIAPELGPKAIKALDAFEIKAYMMNNSETVQQMIDAFLADELTAFGSASVKSHRGLRKA